VRRYRRNQLYPTCGWGEREGEEHRRLFKMGSILTKAETYVNVENYHSTIWITVITE
jgi:hypothetical protein